MSDEIFVISVQGEVDVQVGNGRWEPLRPGITIRPGNQRVRICAGKGAQAAVAFGTEKVKIVGQESVVTIEAEVQGDHTERKVTQDPGVGTVSVKQLPQFQSDFQVSTPRLTVSTRG